MNNLENRLSFGQVMKNKKASFCEVAHKDQIKSKIKEVKLHLPLSKNIAFALLSL